MYLLGVIEGSNVKPRRLKPSWQETSIPIREHNALYLHKPSRGELLLVQVCEELETWELSAPIAFSDLLILFKGEFIDLQCKVKGSVVLKVFALEKLMGLHQDFSNNRRKKALIACLNVTRALHPDLGGSGSSMVNSHEFYQSFENCLKSDAGYFRMIQTEKDLEHVKGLKPSLRAYQQAAVKWMLSREMFGNFIPPEEIASLEGWTRFYPITGSEESFGLYINRFTLQLSKVLPLPVSKVIKGGILADEMGLGKTVEFIACCLLHPCDTHIPPFPSKWSLIDCSDQTFTTTDSTYWSDLTPSEHSPSACFCSRCFAHEDDGDWISCELCNWRVHENCCGGSTDEVFVCVNCKISQLSLQPIPCKTTLIVCPPSIVSQWSSEFAKHVEGSSLKLLRYTGVKDILETASKRSRDCRNLYQILNPEFIASFDVVITTYDVLSNELRHTKDANRTMRYKKRYKMVKSPLTALSWWRIALDEAQMIENASGTTFEMAVILSSTHKWCISGTPIAKGNVKDMQALLSFLEVEPFSREDAFKHLQNCVNDLVRIFRTIFWRTTKDMVKDQLGIPPQSEIVHKIIFSPVERHFYEQQWKSFQSGTRNAFESGVATMIEGPLAVLRQACCHPQLGAKGLSAKHNEVLSLDQILHRLIEKQRVQATGSQRTLTMHLLGLAGISRCFCTKVMQESSPTEQRLREELKWLRRSQTLYLKVIHISEQNRKPGLLTGTYKIRGEVLLCQQLRKKKGLVDLIIWEGNRMQLEIDFDSVHQKTLSGIHFERVKDVPDGIDNTLTSSQLDTSPVDCTIEAYTAGDGYEVVTTCHVEGDCNGIVPIQSNARSNQWRLAFNCSSPAPKGILLQFKEAEIVTDDLQLLHTHFNLSLVHEMIAERCANTPHIEPKSETLLHEIRKRYLGNYQHQHHFSREKLQMLESQFIESFYKSDFIREKHKDDWWSLVLGAMESEKDNEILSITAGILCIDETHLSQDRKQIFHFPSFSSIGGLVQALNLKLDEIEGMRQNLVDNFLSLSRSPEMEEILETADCRKCQSHLKKQGEVCANCCRLIALMDLEKRVFPSRVSKDEAGDMRSPCYGILKAIHQWLQRNSTLFKEELYRDLLQEGSLHLDQWILLEKQTKAMKSLYTDHQELLLAYDEIQFACSSLTLAVDETDTSQTSIQTWELPEKYQEAQNAVTSTESDLQEDLSQLTYLKNIAEGFFDESGQICPVCLDPMTEHVSIVACGHAFHPLCISRLSFGASGSIKCPVCRRSSLTSEISLTSRLQTHLNSIKGSWGSKVFSIVSDVLSLPFDDKCIVFSQWDGMLDIIQCAFSENNVHYVRGGSRRTWDTSLGRFQKDPSVKALLLPLKKGAEGLNLTVATHVFLIEPLLNLSLEAQALNRIHRIGQTRRTTIHRYIVTDTIEEDIERLRNSKVEKIGDVSRVLSQVGIVKGEELTMTDLKELFRPKNG